MPLGMFRLRRPIMPLGMFRLSALKWRNMAWRVSLSVPLTVVEMFMKLNVLYQRRQLTRNCLSS